MSAEKKAGSAPSPHSPQSCLPESLPSLVKRQNLLGKGWTSGDYCLSVLQKPLDSAAAPLNKLDCIVIKVPGDKDSSLRSTAPADGSGIDSHPGLGGTGGVLAEQTHRDKSRIVLGTSEWPGTLHKMH